MLLARFGRARIRVLYLVLMWNTLARGPRKANLSICTNKTLVAAESVPMMDSGKQCTWALINKSLSDFSHRFRQGIQPLAYYS